ncbi:MAG: sigma-70 family RNA polymerase sigma factor [Actinomycetes bacterium]
MTVGDWVTEAFEESRPRLRAVAYRMLGSPSDADDAVQEAWLRLARHDPAGIDNLAGWLTTVVARISLDTLRSRRSRPEEAVGGRVPDTSRAAPVDQADHDTLLAESIGPALMVVLDTLQPAERLAFVLHDLFAVPFEEIAPILDRSPAAARQLASRARRKVRVGEGGTDPERAPDAVDHAGRERQRRVVEAFLAASHDGDFDALLAVLDPEVVLRADAVAVEAAALREKFGAPPLREELRGATPVARTFLGRAAGAQGALVDGSPGAVWAPGGHPRAVFNFVVRDGTIVAIEIVADPERIRTIDLVM